MKHLTVPFLLTFLFFSQIHPMEVVGLFGNTLNTPVHVYYANGTFYKIVQPNEQIPLKMRTFTIKVHRSNTNVTSSDNGGCFYSYTYLDEDGDDRLLTMTNIENWRNAAHVYNVKTNAPRPQDSVTVEFLKERLKQIHAYNKKN